MLLRASLSSITLCLWASSASAQPSHHVDARLTATRGEVEVCLAPEAPAGTLPLNPPAVGPAHPGAVGEALPRGSRVRTGTDGTAEITLGPQRLHLGNTARMVIHASAVLVAPPASPPTTTTLVRGSVRADLIEDNVRAPVTSLAAPSAMVFLGRGEAVVRANPAAQSTHLAVYRGRVRIRSGTREMILRAGFSVAAVSGPVLTPARPLPPPPLWTTLPPQMVVSGGEALDVAGRFGLARGATMPAHWRTLVARDEAFTDIVSDTREPGSNLAFSQRGLGPGAYFVRISAVDSELVEGFPGAIARVTIAAPRVLPAAEGRNAAVEVPAGFRCGLDGAILALWPRPVPLIPGRSHRVRCASLTNNSDVREVRIPGSEAGPLVHEIRLNPPQGNSDLGSMTVRLQDSTGAPVSWASFAVRTTGGIHIAPIRETEQRGIYTAPVHWDSGVRGARIELRVNDAVTLTHSVGSAPEGELTTDGVATP